MSRELTRRRFLSLLAKSAIVAPLGGLFLRPRPAKADPVARRFITFYFPDGVAGPSANGEPSEWHCSGSETNFTLGKLLEGLSAHKDDCLFFNGLTMGPTDSGSHPGGAKKLLTGADGGNNRSIDVHLAEGVGSGAPTHLLYLGAHANANNASGDKHITYSLPGQSITPIDSPKNAFEIVFGTPAPVSMMGAAGAAGAMASLEGSVIDGILDDLDDLRQKLGPAEKAKLDLHLESVREVEKRVKTPAMMPPPDAPDSCKSPALGASLNDSELYDPGKFPEVLRAQIDLMLLAMQCGRTRVGTLQCSVHTSELIMSRFPGTPMYDPGFDMRSHQASHYGPAHDTSKREYRDYLLQRQYWVSQFAYLLDELKKRPDESGSMLDSSVVLLCTEVCDGNTHLHDNMPFVLAGRASGKIKPGRLLQYDNVRHGNLLVSIANAMGDGIGNFGDSSSGPLAGVLV